MKCDELFKEIEALNDKYLKVWEDVCNIESPTNFKEGVDAVGQYFIQMAEERGWRTEIFKQPVSGNVICITLNPKSQAKPITFSGHVDTVHPIGLFGKPAVKMDEEKIYGPGVTDCKGGVVASFMAMDALDRVGFRERPVQLLLQTDEEVGSRTSNKETIGYICRKAANSIAFLNMEGYSKGKAYIQRKGIITYKFTISGQAAHSSMCSTRGASAIAEAAHKILELEKVKNPNGLTCNCGMIQGGTAVNTVPAQCIFFANFRYATLEELNIARELVGKLAAENVISGCSCEVEQTGYRTAMVYEERNIRLLQAMNDIYASNGLPVLNAMKGNGGSDAADVTEYGIPCIDSLGTEGGFLHSKDEYAWLRSLAEAAKRVAAVAYLLDINYDE